MPGAESTHFWWQLTQAGLVTAATAQPRPGSLNAASADEIYNYYPQTALNNRSLWIPVLYNRLNHYAIYALGSMATITYNPSYRVTPLQAHAIDRKLDDAQPLTGIILATRIGGASLGTLAISAEDCIASSTAYQLTGGNENRFECGLLIRAGF